MISRERLFGRCSCRIVGKENGMRSISSYKRLIALVCLAAPCGSQTEECAPLTAGARARIAAYAAEQYELAPDDRVDGVETIAKSCFRRVTVQSVAPKKAIVLYLSPDQRFLSETLLDTSVSPAIEHR
jgi:hypothetical protein